MDSSSKPDSDSQSNVSQNHPPQDHFAEPTRTRIEGQPSARLFRKAMQILVGALLLVGGFVVGVAVIRQLGSS